MPIRVALNGLGRIGRQVFRVLWTRFPEIEIAAIGVTNPHVTESRAIVLEYDSVYGHWPHSVEPKITPRGDALVVDGKEIPLSVRRARHVPIRWSSYGVDIVIEATGFCKARAHAEQHLHEGARKVIVTAPLPDDDITIAMGLNHADYDPAVHDVISAGSATTNCVVLLADVLHRRYGVRGSLLSSVHAYTTGQQLLDHVHTDPRRSRAAALNIVPSQTRAAKAAGRILPLLATRFNGTALAVPIPTVTLTDYTAQLDTPVTAEAANAVFREEANGRLKGILAVCDEPLVSADFIGNTHSAVVDAPATLWAGCLLKVVAWYDNEVGFSNRVAELTALVARSLEPAKQRVLEKVEAS